MTLRVMHFHSRTLGTQNVAKCEAECNLLSARKRRVWYPKTGPFGGVGCDQEKTLASLSLSAVANRWWMRKQPGPWCAKALGHHTRRIWSVLHSDRRILNPTRRMIRNRQSGDTKPVLFQYEKGIQLLVAKFPPKVDPDSAIAHQPIHTIRTFQNTHETCELRNRHEHRGSRGVGIVHQLDGAGGTLLAPSIRER